VDDVAKAIDFYAKAFGATEGYRFTGPDGRLMHAEIGIGDGKIMLGTPCHESGADEQSRGDESACSLYLYVADADAVFERAVSAGAKQEMPVEDTFWGDRMGQLTDPFGHRWMLATHTEDLTGEQIRQRAEEFFASKAAAH
jgi:PhnB protein